MNLLNNTSGQISKLTQVFVAKATPAGEYAIGTDFCNVAATPGMVLGQRENGAAVTVSADANVTILRFQKDGYTDYKFTIDAGAATFYLGGKDTGAKTITASRVNPGFAFVPHAVGHPRGNKIDTEASNQFGFQINMTPSVNTKATTLNVQISNSSLIGYTSDGSPRIQKGADIDTQFVISNEGTKLVIGGIEKRSVMSVSGGVPFLKDLPVIGWIFSTETEATKRSQLLVVAEVVPENKADNYKSVFEAAQKKLKKAGESNTYGYNQFFIDSERQK